MNIFAVIVLIILICKICEGFKRGMVKEIISFISLIVLCVVVVLLGAGLQSYLQKEIVGVIIAVMLLCVLGIAHHLLGVVFFSAKLVSKLPVVRWVDKILGMAVGALETVFLLWTVYAFIMSFGLGMVGQQIIAYTQENSILSWLYQYNYLAAWIDGLSDKITFLEAFKLPVL